MPQIKFCPILLAGSIACEFHVDLEERCKCLREECEWWNEKDQRCEVVPKDKW